MQGYVLNKRSGVLHKLPADERCNTDDIRSEHRFELHASEEFAGMIGYKRPILRCMRCFGNAGVVL